MTGEVGAQGLHALRFPRGAALRLAAGVAPGGARLSSAMHAAKERRDLAEWPLVQRLAGVTQAFLEAFFRGEAPREEPALDLAGYAAFDRLVWQAAHQIGFGCTETYSELARRIGRPGAARAVGGALGRNPLVLLVPCHRVLAQAPGRRRLGGFTGGIELKAWLLNRERSGTLVFTP